MEEKEVNNDIRKMVMSSDKYKNFEELKSNETEGIDYIIRLQKKASNWTLITPHGGGIEPGTSELVKAIADNNHSYYSFEGTKRKNNSDLHITSEFFDEKQGDEIVRLSKNIIAFHGCAGYPDKILIGGLDVESRALLAASLEKAGFNVDNNLPPSLSGFKPNNICNRGKNGKGIQLELDATVRKKLFKGPDKKGRKEKLPAFYDLVKAVRDFL
jgi:phage replication-related protein YjqB (UPF0714/DUF867 family)